MRNILVNLLTVTLSITASIAFCKDLPITSSDGRFGTRCTPWLSNAKQELCEISFFRLIATPEKYDKRNIKITGFLVREFDRLVLYPDENRYKAGILLEGIELSDDYEIDESLLAKLDIGVFPVTVYGTFDARYDGFGLPRLGKIYNIRSVRLDVRIPER